MYDKEFMAYFNISRGFSLNLGTNTGVVYTYFLDLDKHSIKLYLKASNHAPGGRYKPKDRETRTYVYLRPRL